MKYNKDYFKWLLNSNNKIPFEKLLYDLRTDKIKIIYK